MASGAADSSSSSAAAAMELPPVAASLWHRSRSQALLALYHPFVVSLAAGLLPINTFRHYLSQDAFFLQAFAGAYGLAIDNVDDPALKLSITELQQSVIEELKLHSAVSEDSGIDLIKKCKPTSATLRYTEFLSAVAAGRLESKDEVGAEVTLLDRKKLAAFTIGAMTPCMRLYAFLGQEIAKSLKGKRPGSPFNEWIDTYSSASFGASTLQIEQVLESLAESLDEEENKRLEMLYHKAMNLELEFFSAQPDLECAHVPFFKSQKGSDLCYLLVSDFDSTCSITDSCPALAEVSIKAAVSKEMENADGASRPSIELKRKWDLLVKSYSEQYTSLLSEILPREAESSCRSYNCDELKTFLEQLSKFEIQSNSKVVEAGVLHGLDMKEVRKAGGEILLQQGCANFFRQLSSNFEVKTHILSVCWSQTFIEGALSNGGIPSVIIHSNELVQNNGITSGDIDRRVETPFDKERLLEDIRNELVKSPGRQVISVYIGDSVTDLLCMLKADLGIVVGSNSMLRKTAKAYGLSVTPLYEGILEKVRLSQGQQGWTASDGILYSVMDWHEIHACLIGLPVSVM